MGLDELDDHARNVFAGDGVCLAGGQKTTLFSTPQSLKAYCRRSGVSDRVSDVFVS